MSGADTDDDVESGRGCGNIWTGEGVAASICMDGICSWLGFWKTGGEGGYDERGVP